MAVEIPDDVAEQVNGALEAAVPCLVATSSKDGNVDVAVRGSVYVFDKDHLAFWERSLNETLNNLRENKGCVVFFRNPATRATFRFYGDATIYEHGDPKRDEIMSRVIERELNADPERKGFGVLIQVNRVRQGNNVTMER
jgi:hypothetical protein